MAGFQELFKAVIDDEDMTAAKRLISRRGIDVNCRDSFRMTVLHHAAGFGRLDSIRGLVSLGADVNARDILQRTPLIYVLSKHVTNIVTVVLRSLFPYLTEIELFHRVEHMKIYVIRCLVALGADVNAKSSWKTTSLHEAVRRNNVQAVRILAKLGVAGWKTCKWRALHEAMRQNQLLVIEELVVHHGANVNACFGVVGELYDAVQLGRLDIVQALLENQADMSINGDHYCNFSPVLCATLILNKDGSSQKTLVGCLSQLGADFNLKCSRGNVLGVAVIQNHPAILEYLLRKGGDVNSHDSITFTGTPLGFAIHDICESEPTNCHTIGLLLRHGADVDRMYEGSSNLISEAVRRGNLTMVKLLGRFKADPNTSISPCGISPVYDAARCLFNSTGNDRLFYRTIMTMLLRSGADVNTKFSNMLLLQYAVSLGNLQMVSLLNTLGANVSAFSDEECTLLHLSLIPNFTTIPDTIVPVGSDYENVDFDVVKAVVEAGADINATSYFRWSLFHTAIKRSDFEMVELLHKIGADVNFRSAKSHVTPLNLAISLQRYDIVHYLLKKGAKLETSYLLEITPVHEAIDVQNIKMIDCLVKCGARLELQITGGCSPLSQAIRNEDVEMVELLLRAGADVNVTAYKVSAYYRLVMMANQAMKNLAKEFMKTWRYYPIIEILCRGLTDECIYIGNLELLETLIRFGIDVNYRSLSPLHHIDGPKLCKWFTEFLQRLQSSYIHGLSPLASACISGEVDAVRLLLIAKGDVQHGGMFGTPSLGHLNMIGIPKNCYDHVLLEATTCQTVTQLVNFNFTPVVLCQSMQHLISLFGIGNVDYASSLKEINEKVQILVQRLTEHLCLLSSRIIPCGSSAEGTKVGMPNEMDFLVDFTADVGGIKDARNGYAYYASDSDDDEQKFVSKGKGSKTFHSSFEALLTVATNIMCTNQVVDDLRIFPREGEFVKDCNRKATSPLRIKMVYPPMGGISPNSLPRILISVDIVPCLHMKSWPEHAISETWLLDQDGLLEQGYVLVPKPPHIDSDLAKEYTTEELKHLWKISFAHVETYHMQRLDTRVKDAYVVAKCVRNPDVCRIMISDGGSLPRKTEKYVTSYMLKMVFFHLVPLFLESDLSLGEMVCMLYDALEKGLSNGFIPLYFMPTLNILDGHKLDIRKCAKVASVMRRFVKALYLRDSLVDDIDADYDEEILIYERNRTSIYKSVNI